MSAPVTILLHPRCPRQSLRYACGTTIEPASASRHSCWPWVAQHVDQWLLRAERTTTVTRSRLTRLLVLLAFLLALLPGAPATALSLTPPQAVADDGHILIAESDLTTVVKRPTTDGEYVAWVRGAESPATSCHTLFVAPIRYLANRWSTGIQRGSPFAISNDVVIWAGAVRECRQYVYDADPGIYGAHLVSGQQYTITTDSIIDLELWQGTVVWITKEGSQSRSSVRMRDLDGGDPIDIARTGEQMLAFQLRYHGDRVFWLETPEDRSSFQVMSVQPGQPSLVLHTAAEIDWFDVTGNHLIWLRIYLRLANRW
jgi:hypothetical protein